MGSSGSLLPVFAPTPGFPFSATCAWSEPWGFAQARSQRFRPPPGSAVKKTSGKTSGRTRAAPYPPCETRSRTYGAGDRGFCQPIARRFRPPLGGKNGVGFRGHARGRKPRGLCAASLHTSEPPSGSATRLDHREDACPHSGRQARPCLHHLSESRVCCCGSGRCSGHFLGIAAIPGRNRLRLRIANPPSSVRLRPEPLNRRPSRCPGNSGRRGGFFVFSNECLRIARLRI